MSAQPMWSPVDDDTADLLSLVSHDQLHPTPEEEWQAFCRALLLAADNGVVRPNTLRPMVRNHIAPRRVGAFTNRALAEGLIAWTGEWQVSDDTEGRNSGRPMRVYRLLAHPPT